MRFYLIVLGVVLLSCGSTQPTVIEPDYSRIFEEGVPYNSEEEIANKIDYPQELLQNKKGGEVHIAFLVNKYGEVASIEYLKSFDTLGSIAVVEVIADELFFPRRINHLRKPTLFYSKTIFNAESELIGIEFSETNFLDSSAEEEQRILTELTGGRRYFTEPVLIGGMNSLVINYPEEAKAEKIEGTVMVQFIVDKSGNVVEPELLTSLGYGCDEEAIRAVQRLKFEPGINNGEPVRVNYQMPVYFVLPN